MSWASACKGQSRIHTESDLRGYLTRCKTRGLDPLAATRPHIEVYVRWRRSWRRFKPSTVSRRMSVVAGFYRTCVIDDVLLHSPAEYVRRPNVPAEPPTLGLTHLQLEALLRCARESTNQFDFALVTMLGLLGLRISRPPAVTSKTSAKNTGTEFSVSTAKGTGSCWSRYHQPWDAPSNARSAAVAPARFC